MVIKRLTIIKNNDCCCNEHAFLLAEKEKSLIIFYIQFELGPQVALTKWSELLALHGCLIYTREVLHICRILACRYHDTFLLHFLDQVPGRLAHAHQKLVFGFRNIEHP